MKKFLPKILYVFVLVVVFLLHLSYINNGFVWLDHGDIEEGRAVISLDRLSDALFTRLGDTGFYRPLVTITESIDHSFYGGWTPGYHFTNVGLHLVVVALVPLFLLVFFRFTFFETLFAMVLIGVHPLGWLPVGAIAYRSELLLAIFTFLTLYFHSKARIKGVQVFEFLAVVSFFLALLSKETALVLIPALIVFWEFAKGKKKLRTSLWALVIPEIVVIGLYLFLRFQAVPEIWRFSGRPLPLSDAIGTHLFAFTKLLFDFISPLKPDLSDAVPVTHILNPVVAAVLVCFLLVALLIKRTGIFSDWSKGLLLFFILLSPALAIIPVPRLGSPHYAYIALPAYAALVIVFLRVFKKLSAFAYWGVSVICLIWLLFMGYVTFMSGFRFNNDVTLFLPEVQKDQHFLEGHFYLGNYYLLHNETKLAEDAYLNALKTSPATIAYNERSSVLYNLALTETKRKEYGKVVALLRGRDEVSANPDALLLLVNALYHMHKDKEALLVLQKAKPLWNEIQWKKAEKLIDFLKKEMK